MKSSVVIAIALLGLLTHSTFSEAFSSHTMLALSADKQLQQTHFRHSLKSIVQQVSRNSGFISSSASEPSSRNFELRALHAHLEDCIHRTQLELSAVPAYTQHYESFLRFEFSRSFELAYVHFLQACKQYAAGDFAAGDRSIDIVAAEFMALGDTVFGCLGPSNEVLGIVRGGVECFREEVEGQFGSDFNNDL